MNTAARVCCLAATYGILIVMAWTRVVMRFFKENTDDPIVQNAVITARKEMFYMNVYSYVMTVFSAYLNGSMWAVVLTTPQSLILSTLVSVVIEIVLGELAKRLNRNRLLPDETTLEIFMGQFVGLIASVTVLNLCINEMVFNFWRN